MQWFSDLKIGAKLIVSVAFIAGIIGMIGINDMPTINNADTKLYERVIVPLGASRIYVLFEKVAAKFLF
jgi:methyl-accepting chemotaxis protein